MAKPWQSAVPATNSRTKRNVILKVSLTIPPKNGEPLRPIPTLTAWKRAQILAENPDLGMAREILSKGLLSFPYESHILYYKKHARGIVIVRVLHQHMDPVKHL